MWQQVVYCKYGLYWHIVYCKHCLSVGKTLIISNTILFFEIRQYSGTSNTDALGTKIISEVFLFQGENNI